MSGATTASAAATLRALGIARLLDPTARNVLRGLYRGDSGRLRTELHLTATAPQRTIRALPWAFQPS